MFTLGQTPMLLNLYRKFSFIILKSASYNRQRGLRIVLVLRGLLSAKPVDLPGTLAFAVPSFILYTLAQL